MDFCKISRIIIGLKNADLLLRSKLLGNGKLDEGYNPEMEKLHIDNTKILSDIINSIGYPTIDKVGKEASEAAWLIIQHSISNPTFMKNCLRLMQKELKNNKEYAINFAHLTDRIAVFENKPQHYGTQFDWDANGRLNPYRMDDLIKVNQRRKSIGLNTLQQQTETLREHAKIEGHSAPADYKKRREEFDRWRKKVGWL